MSEVVALRPHKVDGVDFVLSDVVTSVALDSVFKEACRESRPVVVTDDIKAVSLHSVLIIGESDLAAARAMELIRAKKLGSACPRDMIHAVPDLVRALGAGCVAVPDELVTRARRAPALTDDLYEVLSLVRLGYSNAQIANRMHCSLATAKRRIHELTVLFAARNRLELVGKTRAL